MPRLREYPRPTSPEPSIETIEEWEYNDEHEATDGCHIEPDGTCEHGYPSWLLYWGLI